MKNSQSDISQYIQGLAEHSDDVFWVKNIDFTRQIYISPSYEKIWGRSCQSIYDDPKSWTDYVVPEDLDKLYATVEKCREHMTRETQYTQTYRIQRADKTVLWIREKGFLIYDSHDNVMGFGGVAQDITKDKKNRKIEAEVQVLSEERDTYEEYLRSIIDSIGGSHWWKDKAGVYRGYNRNLLKSLGYKLPCDIIGKTDFDLPWADQADHLVTHDNEVMRRGVTIEREEVVKAPNGEELVYLVNKSPLRDPRGEIVGTIGHGFDITDIKKAQIELECTKQELADEKDSIESRLNAIIDGLPGCYWVKDLEGRYLSCGDSWAHFFGMSSSADIVGKTNAELPWACYAKDAIKYEAQVIQHGKTIHYERFYKKPSDGESHYFLITKAPIRDRQGEIIGVISHSVDITEAKQMQHELKIVKEQAAAADQAKSAILSMMSCDLRTPLNSILGSAEILCSKTPSVEAKEHVEDIRQAADHLLKIINLMLDSAQREQGTLSLSSEEDAFLTDKAHEVKMVATNNQPKKLREALYKNCRVLVVEDNQLNQKVTRLLLEELGCFVDIAPEGKTAIAMVEKNIYHIIFMDIGLPEMDGVAVAKYLRNHEEAKDIPIVALTAHVMQKDLQRCQDVNMDAIMTKPVAIDDFKDILARFCSDLPDQKAYLEVPV
jgi:PAS domain S-box-containing protein